MKYRLAGAILGDIAGSSYEWNRVKKPNLVNIYSDYNNFTDDTVCTIAIADALLHPLDENMYDFSPYLKKWCRKYPNVGYGANFKQWFMSDDFYLSNSYGNGSAMRVSPIGYFAKDVVDARILAQQSCMNSHAHIEGIRGAQAIAESVFKMYNDYDQWIPGTSILGDYYPWYYYTYETYNRLEPRDILDEIRPDYTFKVSCQQSVPIALLCFNAAESYEDCIKKAISMGGDSDTLAAMAGGIAYAHFKEMTPESINFFEEKLPDEMMEVVVEFDKLIDERNKNR